MRSSGSASEFGAAALGQLGGGLLSPEAVVGVGAGAKGASQLWRLGKAALQQGATNVALDLPLQGLNIQSGVQEQYDPMRTAMGFGLGAVTGAGAKAANELITRLRYPPAYHYTRGDNIPSIMGTGLGRPNARGEMEAFATTNRNLSPLQAQIDLALPRGRPPDSVLRINRAELHQNAKELPAVVRVARNNGMPGGGSEMIFDYKIDPRYLKVVKP